MESGQKRQPAFYFLDQYLRRIIVKTLEDKHIIQIANRDINIFNSFYNQVYPNLCKYCSQIVKTDDLAADISQEAMIEFWLKKPSLTSFNQSEKYLYTIAKNKCLNILRKRKIVDSFPMQQLVDKYDDIINSSYLKDEELYILSRAINLLPNQTQKIIRLMLNNYRNSEITEELDISINTVKTLKKRAYKKLRTFIKDYKVA